VYLGAGSVSVEMGFTWGASLGDVKIWIPGVSFVARCRWGSGCVLAVDGKFNVVIGYGTSPKTVGIAGAYRKKI
jgi:hypothetical protein